MPLFKINVKWQKEKFSDLECDTDQPPEVFKALLFSLSGVPPDRQKIMMAGGVLKDHSWENIKLKNGVTVMMMGNTQDLPKEPPKTELPKFVEDMDDDQLARALDLPSGLNNLGNTCYMNATLQCLYSIPELRDVLPKLPRHPTSSNPEAHSLVVNLADLFTSMGRTSAPVSPAIFLAWMHNMFPQFATPVAGGQSGGGVLAGALGGAGWQQQDANECWTELIMCLSKVLTSVPCPESAFSSEGGPTPRVDFIRDLMGGDMECTLSSEETPDEEPIVTKEKFNQLSCFIDKDVKYLQSGLKSAMEGSLEKTSPTLGKNAVYKKISKICRLPAYLSIQFVRFYYKEKENINAKVLKDVKFPMTLDMFEFCSPDFQKRLLPMRDRFKTYEDHMAQQVARKKKGDVSALLNKNGSDDKTTVPLAPFTFPDDPGSNNSGYYELQAVLTHQGRSSNSGHYVAWVRRHEDEWYKFDDDRVSTISSEEVLRLSGGGDWHCAYVLLYGPRRLKLLPELQNTTAVDDTTPQTSDTTKMETS